MNTKSTVLKLILLTERPGFWGCAKYWFKKMDPRIRGPRMVAKSLLRGLSELGVIHKVNPIRVPRGATVGVLSGVRALEWAIEAKKAGMINKLIAGPNIAMPGEHGGIIFNKDIDIFLTPSTWIKDWLISLKPERINAFRVWSAGVETAPITKLSAGRETIIVYKKRCPTALFERIIAELQKRKLPYKVITYGTYNRRAYLRALNMAKGLIFLSESESQGIAIHEAWMMDVPTLVWDRRLFKAGDYEWMGASSAPYLSDEVGVEFKDEQELSTKLDSFLQKLDTFRPRAYHLENFTDVKAAEEYLKFI